jgi:hypothetical protein
MNLVALIPEATAVAANNAVREVRLGGLSDIGQVEQYISNALDKFFEKFGPGLADKLAVYIEPATKKAVEVIKPSVDQALKDYTPTFAAITGGMLALSVLLGVWISKRSYQHYSKPRNNPGCPVCHATFDSWRKWGVHIRRAHSRRSA